MPHQSEYYRSAMPAAPKTVYLSSLQVFRGLAAIGVLVYHACLFTERQTKHVLLGGYYHLGELGVDFFFVLSGFIIMFVHGTELGRPECARRYLSRRFFRVYPLLFILTSVKLAMEFVAWKKGGASPDISRIISSYFLLPDPDGQMPVITAAWTLMHEALFYSLFLLALLMGRRVAAILLGLWLTAIIAKNSLGTDLHGLPRLICDAHNVEFAFGIAACVLFQMRHRFPIRLIWVALVAAFLLLSGVFLYDPAGGMEQPLTVRLVLGAGFAMVILLAGIWEQRLSSSPWPKWSCWLGDASYSIYLGHSMVVLAVVSASARFSPDSMAMRYFAAVLSCLIALVACGSLWRFVERPLLRWSRRWCE
jgi:exopolysaccharide production protein ExoZ